MRQISKAFESWRFYSARFILDQFYNVDAFADRGETWLACHECYMHDICKFMEARYA